MADITDQVTKSPTRRPETTGETETLSRASEEKLLQFSELLFLAYRDFTGDPDAILQELGFGRAHHRVLHFVSRQPGLRVADLLEILKITKQSLGRVLRQLIDTGYVRQEPGSTDRRERLLYLTETGQNLAKQLAAPQLVRLAEALEAAGPDAEAVVKRFLVAMTNAEQPPQRGGTLAEKPASLSGETSLELAGDKGEID
ncbi:MarR family transcriptional regulator [Methyloligella sp. 2.7D]|uniref:MarR family winged helix-turn-helix transcriptional regulator n=1 Tax=unclassified Methyloligella TaxID=2625955 RepID=UPI00157DE4FD|nr:MarR family transcriptional regulator [Methyloligella sp. GL2]QKP77044.1 MarR family transcriptional regulator [Methyloligella sp. GL2]